MLDLSALRTTLAAALAPHPVAGAAEFAAIADTLVARAPTLWLMPLRETAAGNPLVGALHQQITVTLGLVYAVRQVQDPTGAAAADSLVSLRCTAFAALLNTVPALIAGAPAAHPEPLIYAGGQVLHFANALLFWQDQFTARYTLRVT